MCLTISQQPATLRGTAASPTNYCDCYLQTHGHGDCWKSQLHLTSGNSKRSRLRRLSRRNLPQGSVLAPLLFYIHMPTAVSRKYTYAYDLAIVHTDGDWQAVEGVLSKDMASIDEYLQTLKLKTSITQTVPAVFHLNNKEAKRKLEVSHNKNAALLPRTNTSEYRWTGRSRIVDTSSHFPKCWHHASHSWLADSICGARAAHDTFFHIIRKNWCRLNNCAIRFL